MQNLLTPALRGLMLLCLPLSSTLAQVSRIDEPAPERDSPVVTVRRSMEALRLGGAAPNVDGHLDEEVWQRAQPGTGFVQTRPDPGAAASQRTEVRILYDEAAIYVAARMYDSAPGSIVAPLTRRDQIGYSDLFVVGFDSYYDRRTAFAFAVNPRGVKADFFIYNDAEMDEGWDAVWDAAAQVDSAGWTVEMRIPLSQLRYSTTGATAVVPGDTLRQIVWGVQFLRQIARVNEEAFWAPMPPDQQRIVSLFGELRGLRDLPSTRRLEVLPYTVGRVTRAPEQDARRNGVLSPFYERNDGYVSAGADVKYGITSDLTLTATLNPDFGQVEADPAVVNLTAYETFFPEKRPFFVEGADIFRFGLEVGDRGSEQLFYSRRIGRQPQLSPGAPVSGAFSDVPDASTILGAAKLSGKTAGGWSVGLLNAVTSQEMARFAHPDSARPFAPRQAEPMTNYAIGRLIRDFRGGQSAVGGVVTATNRDLDGELAHRSLRSAAYTGGVDARHRFGGGNYEVFGYALGSHVLGSPAAIRRTQESSVRYFQRALYDAEHLRSYYDTTRTSLTGWAAVAAIGKSGGGHWRWGTFAGARSPGFEVNDLGFERETDYLVRAMYVAYQQFRPGRHLRRWSVSTSNHNVWSFGREHLASGVNVNGNLQLPNYWGGFAGYSRDFESLSNSGLRGGPGILEPGSNELFAEIYSDQRKPVSAEINANVSREDDTGARSMGLGAGIDIRIGTQAELSLRPNISRNTSAWQYIDQFHAADTTYLFGHLQQTTTSLTTRLSYTFTPDLSLQLYAQPFISAGDYVRFREVADPRAERFHDRFHTLTGSEIRFAQDTGYIVDRDGDGESEFTFRNPDFNRKALRSTTVLRWEYRPGSTFFVVWSQGRDTRLRDGSFALERDLRRLFRDQPTNVLLVKVSYWLSI